MAYDLRNNELLPRRQPATHQRRVARTAGFAVRAFYLECSTSADPESNAGSGMEGRVDAVDDQAASPVLLFRRHAGVLAEARPRPVFGLPNPSRPDGVQVEVLDGFVVFLHRAQSAVEKASLPQFARRHPATVDGHHGALFGGFDDQRNRHRILRRADGVPVIGKKHPGCQIEWMPPPRPVKGSRQQPEVGVGQLQAPPEQADRDEEISVGKEGATQPRHSDTIRHREDDCQRRTADRKNGGLRYPLRYRRGSN